MSSSWHPCPFTWAPCCEEPDHCFGHFYEEQQKRICRGTAVLYQAMVRWLSWIDQPNFFILCPQVELMAVAKTLRVDEMSFLLAAYSYDGVHLSSTGYRDLFDRLTIVLNSEPWQYCPPTTRMADPVTAPVQAPAVMLGDHYTTGWAAEASPICHTTSRWWRIVSAMMMGREVSQ